MSNKTPIQQALYDIEYKLSYSTTSNDERIALTGTIHMLKGLLPAERNFAEECFDAGAGFSTDIYTYAIIKSPDFSTFYKKYEDGK